MGYSRTNTYGKTARGGVSGSQLADLHEQQTLLAIAAERAKREQEAQLAEEQKKLAAAQRDAQEAAYNKRKDALIGKGMSRFEYNEGYNAYYGDYENILKSDEFKKFLENYKSEGDYYQSDNALSEEIRSQMTGKRSPTSENYFARIEGQYLQSIPSFYRRDEAQLLDYLKETNKEEYKKYKKGLKRAAQERQNGYVSGFLVSDAKEHPVISSIETNLSAPVTGIAAGIASIQDTVDVAKGRELNPYSTAHQMSGRTSLIRETVSSDMSGVGAFIYNTAMSVGDNIVNFAFAGGLLGGAPAAGTAAANIANAITTVLMSSPAAADAILEASDAGMTDGQAVLYGWLIGASAAASEYINPTEKIVRGAGPKKLITNVVRSALMEGVEEINNNIADEAINRIFSSTTGVVMSESEKLYDDMISQGYSENEALKSSLWLFAKDAGTAFLGGAVAGGVMSGGATAVKTPFIYSSMGSDVSADTKARADMIQNIRDNPDVYSKDTLRAAKKASARLDSGKEGIRTDMAVGKARFRAEIDLSTSKAMNDSVTAELKQRLVKTGMKAETAAKVAQKMVDAWEVDNKQKNNEKLTRIEKSAQKEIEKNYPAAKNLLSDLSARQSVIKAASESKSVQSLRNATQNMAENLGAAGQSNIRKSGDANYREYLEKVGGVDLSEYESGTENYKNLVVTDIDRNTGKVTVRNKAGEVMNATAAGVDADTAALLYYAASFDSKEDANAFLSGYDFVKDKKGMNPARYDNEMKIVMGLGKLGWDAEKIRKNTSATLTMPDELINMFAKKAREASDSASQAKQKAVDSAAEKAEKSGQKSLPGKVILESGVEEKNLTENQKEQVAALRVLSDIFGYKIRVFSSVKEDGTLENRQGYYNLAKREFGIDIYAGADSVADVCSVAMLRTMSHEMIHMAKQMSPGYFERYSDFIFDNFLSENADELIFRRQRQYEKANNGKKLSYNEAMEEVVADASEMFLKGFLGLKVELGNQAGEGRMDMETVTEDLQKPKYKGVLRVLGNVIERMKRKISAFKRAWNGAQAKTEEGKTVSAGDAKAYEQAQKMFNELILRASANYKLLKDGKWESDSEKSEKASIRGGAEGGAEITENDIAVLRDIPRKSINDFTSEEIQKTEVWAKRFYQELGTKSPYFRAWFGDWRAKDTGNVKSIPISALDLDGALAAMHRGTVKNADSSWDINVGSVGARDTISHSGREKISAKMLSEIHQIIENAVLLDTETSQMSSNKKHNETAWMHKLYALVNYNGVPYIAKVTVEEYGAGEEAHRRFYNLRGIKIEPVGGAPDAYTSYDTMPDTDSMISISDLYALVKTYDKKFSPKPVNPALLNEDGTPRTLYHQTARDFTVFDNSNPVAGASDSETPNGFFFKENDHNIGLGGNKQMAVYLRMTNPLHFKNRQEANRWYCQNITGYERLQNEMTSALQPIEQKMDVIENEMFKDDISDTEYEKLDKQWNELVKQMGEKEDSYRRKLRGLLNDYFIRSDSGYDGIILDYDGHRYVDGKRENVKSYIVFNRSQIKSATDNIGTFDSDNPDIRYSTRNNAESVRFELPETDSDGNTLSEQQRKYFSESKVVDADGHLLAVYHGSPKTDITKFRIDLGGAYFTADEKYATEYTRRDGKVYKCYLNITKPFDTRDAKARKIWETEFYQQWGNGSPLSERGIADWTDGDDLIDFIREKGYDYDGLVLDEGGTPNPDGGVRDRGISYVVFDKQNQVKYADNRNPTDNPDIRYSTRAEEVEFSDKDVRFSVRDEAPPKKTIEGYKVFVVKDGKLYPPMVANPNAEDTPVGVWLNADIGQRAPDSKTGRAQVKAGGKGTQGGSGSLAFRPGWHLGEIPLATQFDRLNPETGKKELFPENFVWALCDVAADVDYQKEAMSYGYTKNGKFQHSLAGLPKLPTDGYYRYRTNPNPETVPWLITGAMKVKKLLGDAEVNEILKSKGLKPKERVGGNKTLSELGLDKYDNSQSKNSLKENISDVLTGSSRTFADSLTEPTKYQTRDGSTTDYVTSRLALADAFEQIATNQRERNWAARYRERAEELAGYNTRLRELWKDYFTKGHSAAERAEIRTQIRSLTQKIQTADGGLTQFVNAKPLAAYVTRVQNEVARQERENSRAKLAEFRKSENALVRSILEEHRQKLAQRRAAGERKNVIDKMGRLSGKFLSMLEHPAEGSAKHFNAGIVRSALEVLDTLGNGDIDLQRKMEERAAKIAKIEEEMEKLATGENAEEPRVLDRIEELRGQKQRLETYLIGNTQNANALKEKLAELRERYESDDFKNTGEYDETISQMLKYLREEIAGKPVSELTTEQLQKAYDIMKAIYKTSTDANKLIGSKFRESVEELSHDFIGDMEKSGHKNRKYLDPYFVMQLRPRTFFSYLSGGKGEGSAAVKLYNMLNDGQTQMLTIKRDAYLLFSDLINGKQNRENIDNMAEMVDIGLKDRNGNKVEISRGMMITLYMHLQNEQNAAHFMMGGLSVPNMKAYYKGDYDGAFRSGANRRVYGLANAVFQLQEQLETTRADLEAARALKNNKLAAELEGRISGLESSLATAKAEMMVKAKELSDQIEKKFTAYERRYVEAAKAFFWEFSGDTLNKTAMERYGFNRFTVKNYFPIQTDTRYLMSAKADMATFSKNFSLEAMGMTKDRVGATNPLLLLDISAIVDRHINDVSLYAGFVQAVHNFNKVYNFTDKNYQKSVKAEINDYFGASATKYIDKLLLDIAGARRQEPNVLDKFRSNYAGAVLSVNAGVTLKQAASLPTAAAVLGWKNMGTATARFAKDWESKKNWRETFETIQKYTPLLWYRQRGYMDADIGDIYRGKSISDTVTEKVPWLMNWITAMDAHTVGSLWYACEENVKNSNKALQVGSEEYYKEVAKLFNQVTYDTQPNYTVMQRPDILRNPNALVRALFMFKTQIMQNFNILAEACMEYGYARKNFEKGSAEMRAAKVKLSRAITSQLVAALIIALIDGTRKLIRRNLMGLGKEIEITHIPLEYANAFMSSLFGTFTGGTEIYEMVYSIVSGDRYYGFGDVDAIGVPADIANEIVNISKSAINGNFEWQDLEGFAGKLARAFGLPIENILKILKGLYNISMKIIER